MTLTLTTEQMQKIANDKMVLVKWRDEWIHLCRCEPISAFDEYHIAHSGKPKSVQHIQGTNSTTLCNKKYQANWILETRITWTHQCKMCKKLINKEK